MGLAKACFRPFRGGDRVLLLSPIGLVYKETTNRPEKTRKDIKVGLTTDWGLIILFSIML